MGNKLFTSFVMVFFFGCSGGESAEFGPNQPDEIEDDGGAEECSPTGGYMPCDDVCAGGMKQCRANGTYGKCVCPDDSTGGSGGSAGSDGSGGTSDTGGSAGTSGSSGTGGSEPFSVECDQYGVTGKVIVVVQAPVLADHSLFLGGWINFPNWMGSDVDTEGGIWCTSDANKNKLVCVPKLDNNAEADIVAGTELIMWPGLASSDPTAEDKYFCEEQSCPVGTYVVCNGKDEVCAARDGVLSGNMEYADAPWVNLSCLVE